MLTLLYQQNNINKIKHCTNTTIYDSSVIFWKNMI